MALHFHNLIVKDIKHETPDCVSIAFEIPKELQKEFRFIQGQNITIKTVLDDTRRSYSICSSPLDNEFRVAVKKVENGFFSSFANDKLKIGDVLEVMPPTGTFFTEVKPDQKREYVFFASGSGITPIISIIKTILKTEAKSNVTLIYGNKSVTSIIFKEELEALKDKHLERFRIYHILSREKTDSDFNYGRIDIDKCNHLSRLIDFNKVDEFFICGPEQMIFTVKDFLNGWGINFEKIHFELFTTPTREHIKIYTTVKEASEEGSEISVTLDGRTFDFTLDFNGNTILEAALAEGADVPFACKGGVCCTCKAKLLEGKVEMEANYGLDKSELKAGYILTCQSHPRTKRVIVDYDAV
ncbi:MAG: phenylacetate-CoA oxygenase/reductase subunit PaaK [Bacteroidota bacterium]|nr:phenylacetate-CoA oxygenase/reductase subunit PaaK [Bacteroidota bacterium]